MRTVSLAGRKVALSFEGRSLQVLVVQGRQVRSWMSLPLPPEAFQDGSMVPGSTLQALLSSLFYGRESLRGRTAVCLPGGRALFRTISLPRLKPRLLAEAISREAQRELPLDQEQVYIFWQRFDATEEKQDYLLVGVPKDIYDRFYATFRGARTLPRLWDLKPLALVRAVGRPRAVVLHLEQEATELIVVDGYVPRLTRSLAEPPDLPAEERARRLAEQVSRTVEYYVANQSPGAWDAQAPVVVTGPLASEAALVEAFRAASPMSVEAFVCPLLCPPEFPSAAYAAAIGLTLKKGTVNGRRLGRQSVDFNLLPQQYRRAPLPLGRVAVGLALALGVGLLVPMFQAQASYGPELSARRSELARLQRLTAAAKAGVVERAEVQQQIDQATGLARALQQERGTILAAGGRTAEDLHAALALVPAAVSLLRYSSRPDSITVEGEALDFAAVLAYARALEQSGRFPTVAVSGLVEKSVGDAPPVASFTLSIGRRQTLGD